MMLKATKWRNTGETDFAKNLDGATIADSSIKGVVYK